MPLDVTMTSIVSSEAPSNFEDQVTFTATVVDTAGSPTPPTGAVVFQFDLVGFGTPNLVTLTCNVFSISATTSVATYIGANSFSPGTIVNITGFAGGFAQFNGTNLVVASANANQFTVSRSMTAQSQVNQDGVATSTNTAQCQASTTVMPVGVHTVMATYGGDGGHQGSSSSLQQQVVNVAATNVVELPGFTLIASFSTQGDTSLPPQATLNAIPSTVAHNTSVSLLWDTLNVAYVRITGNNHVDYVNGNAPCITPPFSTNGFDTCFLSTSGSGLYVVGNGFTSNITLTLQAYDSSQTAIPGLTSSVSITVT